MFNSLVIRIIIIIFFIFFGYNITFIILTKRRNDVKRKDYNDHLKINPKKPNRFARFGVIILNIFILIACVNIFFYELFTRYIPRINFFFLTETLQVIGITLAAAGNITLNISYRELGVYWEYPIDGKKKKQKLVTTGIYAKIRHPIYLSFYLMCLGLLFIIQDWILLFLFIVGGIGLYLQALSEEKELIEAFPKEYKDYMKSTGRFFVKSRSYIRS
jgi:protein-S-isoprenylcysteine O-methyltransferase Ste14